MKILLVEDDEVLVASLAANLTSQNYTVETVSDGRQGWDYAQAAKYDIVVLDINLPGLDGISLCQKLRQAHHEGAILLLTAEDDSRYMVAGLDAGADDYVVKPCSTEELSARIRALLRRPREIASPILQWGLLQLDPSTRQVHFAHQQVSLSPKEYGLLELFLRNPQRVFSSSVLLERLWGFDEMPGEETIRTHIKRLRRKLKQAGVTGVIENIYGMGYRLMPPPSTATVSEIPVVSLSAQSHPPAVETKNTLHHADILATFSPPPALTATDAARAATAAALGQFKDIILGRIAVLETAATALQQASLSDELLGQAKQASHKLIGSLGMFGLKQEAQLSQGIEQILKQGDLTHQNPRLCILVDQLGACLRKRMELPDPQAGQADNRLLCRQRNGSNRLSTVVEDHPLVEPLTVMVLSTDLTLVKGLQESTPDTLTIQACQTLQQAQQQICKACPDVVLLNMMACPGGAEGLSFIANLGSGHHDLTLMVLAPPENFQERLEISRRCRCTFLSQPTSAPQAIVQNLLQVVQMHRSANIRVLAVDDDPVVLEMLCKQLPNWGIQVDTLMDPRHLWENLPKLKPDLLMLDIEMPHVEGTELCQIIRNDLNWSHMPILFLSAREDAETVNRVYRVGADDYMAKPFTETELVTRIKNRLERCR